MDKMMRKTATVVALLAALLCITSLSSVASAQPCDHNVEVLELYCGGKTTAGWFYDGTSWGYYDDLPTYLFQLMVDGDTYNALCINLTAYLRKGDTFNASKYTAEPTCKNNSIAYILNNWTIDPYHCDNVSAGQSAVWYFWYINETFCSLGTPQYNHTATPGDPDWESNWIPDCTAHPLACEIINESINQNVPYNITISPKTGSYVKGKPVELEAKVDYCLGGVGEEVTVVFETDAGNFSESGTKVYKNKTVNGIAKATLVCNAESANVTVRVENKKWFRIVDPTGCNPKEYQGALEPVNIIDDAVFSFYKITMCELEGYIYEDRNCNCEYNPNYPEPGVANVTVELLNDSTVVNTTKTNASGYYEFTNIPPGDYTVRYNASELPAHLSPKCDDDGGSATEGSVIVPAGGKAKHNFGVKAMVGISIEKLVNGVNTYTATRNETVTFTLKITNTGDVNLTNITVIDALPLKKHNKGLTWTGWADPPADAWASSTNLSGWIHFTIHWNLTQFEPLKPGESFVITFNATVDPEAYGMLRDVAYVTANSSWCSGPVSDEDDAFVYVECKKVPVLTPIGLAALIGLLSLLVVLYNKKKK